MPLLRIQTNVSLAAESSAGLLRQATGWVAAELHKPAEYVQVSLETGACMAFGGTLEPTAFLELRGLSLPKDRAKALSAGLCRFAEETLGVPASRVFINFAEVPPSLWGWNGTTFG